MKYYKTFLLKLKSNLLVRGTLFFVLCSLFLALSSVFLFSSCKPGLNPKNDFLQWAKKGEAIKVICKTDQLLSYQLYLPSYYTTSKTWPAVYCFDSHGDGNMPLALLKEYAEKNGCIVVGSNDSKNGLQPQEIQHIAETMFSDTRDKLSLNVQQLYLCGFSGGARVACSLALTSQIFAGVIACSAGFKPYAGQNLFTLVGIAGNGDMNYLEMKQLKTSLASFNMDYTFIPFQGVHSWPKKELLAQALDILAIKSMKKQAIPLNKIFSDSVLQSYLQKSQYLQATNVPDSLLVAANILQNAISTCSGISDVSQASQLLLQIANNELFIKGQKNEQQLEAFEAREQEKFYKSYTTMSAVWWNEELKTLNKKALENTPEAPINKRLLAYISLMSYSYVNQALTQGNNNAASEFLKIYEAADPQNPDCWYFKAVFFVNTSKLNDAAVALNKAITLGYDKQKALNDPRLAAIHSDIVNDTPATK